MTQAELFELLKANRNNLPLYIASNRRVSADRARIDGIMPKLYYRHNVFSLINDWEDCCRFVIDREQNPVFGDIGKVRGATPGHEEMSNGVCLTAGVLFFEKSKLIGISNESGYFKAELKSLLWALKTFVLDRDGTFEVAEILKIHHFNNDTNGWECLEISTADLQSELSGLTLIASDQLVSTFPLESSQQTSSSKRERADSYDAAFGGSACQENSPVQLFNSPVSSKAVACALVGFGSLIAAGSPMKKNRLIASLPSSPSQDKDDDVNHYNSGHESPVIGLR